MRRWRGDAGGDGARMSTRGQMSGVTSAFSKKCVGRVARGGRGHASRATRVVSRGGVRCARDTRRAGSRVGFERDRGGCVGTVGLATHRDPRGSAAPWRVRCPRTWVWGAAGARRGAGAARVWADPILGRTSRADAEGGRARSECRAEATSLCRRAVVDRRSNRGRAGSVDRCQRSDPRTTKTARRARRAEDAWCRTGTSSREFCVGHKGASGAPRASGSRGRPGERTPHPL